MWEVSVLVFHVQILSLCFFPFDFTSCSFLFIEIHLIIFILKKEKLRLLLYERTLRPTCLNAKNTQKDFN
jgi:hypothetical protein